MGLRLGACVSLARAAAKPFPSSTAAGGLQCGQHEMGEAAPAHTAGQSEPAGCMALPASMLAMHEKDTAKPCRGPCSDALRGDRRMASETKCEP